MESSFLECSVRNDTQGGESEADSDDEPFHMSVRTQDLMEDSITEAFFAETCHCKLGVNNDPCSLALPRRHAVEFHQQCLELSKGELDIAILGQLTALRRREPTIATVSDQGRDKKRRITLRPYTAFRFGDMTVCKNSFLFLHAITLKHFNLTVQYKELTKQLQPSL